MPRRTLVIGLGGTGKACLTFLKERLYETYGQVPDNVVLLSFDTDDLLPDDRFAGSQLTAGTDLRGREPEFQRIVSPPGMTMDRIFADAIGRALPYMFWLEREKLDRVLSPAERDIRGGAQQRRPIGRTGLFLRWRQIYQSIISAVARVYTESPSETGSPPEVDKAKRQIFLVCSVAGGVGSGFLIDVANLVRYVIASNSNWQSVELAAILALPDSFQGLEQMTRGITNLRPNTFATLRELDRFITTHSSELPGTIRYGDDISSITWNVGALVDHVYLVEAKSLPKGAELHDPHRGVFPAIADFVAAHIDEGLGFALASLRSNAGQYTGGRSRPYSSFNIRTYILPLRDIAERFGLRFARELLARQVLPATDVRAGAAVAQMVAQEWVRLLSPGTGTSSTMPNIIRKLIAGDQESIDLPELDWRALFSLIAVSEMTFAHDLADLEGSIAILLDRLVPSGLDDFPNERIIDGNMRLMHNVTAFAEAYVGQPDDTQSDISRAGGAWDRLLRRYPQKLREQFGGALAPALLAILNRRDPQTRLLEPARLSVVLELLHLLRRRLQSFRALLDEQYRIFDLDGQIQSAIADVRAALQEMHIVKDRRSRQIGSSEARRAQEKYSAYVIELMHLLLHQHVYQAARAALDALGADAQDSTGMPSVIDQIVADLENWQAIFKDADLQFARREQELEQYRVEKRRVVVRRYLTDDHFEELLYQDLIRDGMIERQVLGQVRGVARMAWQFSNIGSLQYELGLDRVFNTANTQEFAKQLALMGIDLFHVACRQLNLAERLMSTGQIDRRLFDSDLRALDQPLLRYDQDLNDGCSMSRERYIAYEAPRAPAVARAMLQQLQSIWSDTILVTASESQITYTIVEVSRGVRLEAITQFLECEGEYRDRITRGSESLHLFPEEQRAADYEARIEILGEPDNGLRLLRPELVVAIGDRRKLRLFAQACAYGLIEAGTFYHANHAESRELWMRLELENDQRNLLLTQSQAVRRLDPAFDLVSEEEQRARLYLNALQRFVLIFTEPLGVPKNALATMIVDAQRRGVAFWNDGQTLLITLSAVEWAVRAAVEALGPTATEVLDPQQRAAWNARRRLELLINPFLNNQVARLKRSPLQSIRDLGTVLELELREEAAPLIELALQVDLAALRKAPIQVAPRVTLPDGAAEVLKAYNEVLQIFDLSGRVGATTGRLQNRDYGQFHSTQAERLIKICRGLASILRCPITNYRYVEGLFVADVDASSLIGDLLDTKKRASLPLLMSGSQTIGEPELEAIIAAFQKIRSHSLQFAVLLLFGDPGMIEQARTFLHTRLGAWAEDVATIGHQELEAIFTGTVPQSAFRRQVIGQIDITYISPYKIAGPVSNDLIFSGREEELATIVRGAGTGSYALVGGRSYGKTSILNRLNLFRLTEYGFRSVYVDTRTFSEPAAFLEHDILNWEPDRPTAVPRTFGELLQAPPTDRSFVLLIDEADTLVRADRSRGWEIFNKLRSLSNSRRMQIVLGGGHILRSALSDSYGPLFNFPMALPVGRLSFFAVGELVARPMKSLEIGLKGEQQIIDAVWNATSGHPNIVQRLCHRLVNRLRGATTRVISLGDVQEIVQDRDFQVEDFINVYCEQMSALEHFTILLMAGDSAINNPKAVRQIAADRYGLRLRINEINDALQNLVHLRSLLKWTSSGYQFAVEAFPQVLAKTQVLEDEIENDLSELAGNSDA